MQANHYIVVQIQSLLDIVRLLDHLGHCHEQTRKVVALHLTNGLLALLIEKLDCASQLARIVVAGTNHAIPYDAHVRTFVHVSTLVHVIVSIIEHLHLFSFYRVRCETLAACQPDFLNLLVLFSFHSIFLIRLCIYLCLIRC